MFLPIPSTGGRNVNCRVRRVFKYRGARVGLAQEGLKKYRGPSRVGSGRLRRVGLGRVRTFSSMTRRADSPILTPSHPRGVIRHVETPGFRPSTGGQNVNSSSRLLVGSRAGGYRQLSSTECVGGGRQNAGHGATKSHTGNNNYFVFLFVVLVGRFRSTGGGRGAQGTGDSGTRGWKATPPAGVPI